MVDDQETHYPKGFDPERDIMLDARSLRGIAHPLRNQLLGLLRLGGPSTATKLAERLGLSSAATSYHLRQLAAYGFVVEDEGRGKTRERWWRAAHRTTWFDRSTLDTTDEDAGEVDALAEEYVRSIVDQHSRNLREYLETEHTLPQEWRHVSNFSETMLALTVEEAEQLQAEIAKLLRRYRSRGAPEMPIDARPVEVQYQVFPRFQATLESPSAETDES